MSVLLPEPLRPTIPKTSPARTSKLTPRSACRTSKRWRLPGCSTRSFSVLTRSCGRRNVLATAAALTATSSAGTPLTWGRVASAQMAEALQVPALPLGVNLAGYLDATLGVGEAARNVAAALRAAGVAVAPLPLSSRDTVRDGPIEARTAGHPVTLVCVNPDGMTGAAALEGRHVIGMWWWEVAALPSRWLRAFDLVDEVWAGSRFVADVLGAVAPVPVVHVPLPVAEPVCSGADRASLGLPADAFAFGFVFDYASVAARK